MKKYILSILVAFALVLGFVGEAHAECGQFKNDVSSQFEPVCRIGNENIPIDQTQQCDGNDAGKCCRTAEACGVDAPPPTPPPTPENPNCNEDTVFQCNVCPNTQRCVRTQGGATSRYICVNVDGYCGYKIDAKTTKFQLCNQIPENVMSNNGKAARANCEECINKYDGIWTAIGCIECAAYRSGSPRGEFCKDKIASSIIERFLRVGLMMAGGFTLISMLVAGFMFSVSQGDPKRTNDAKDLVTSSVIGLLFIIFSITILQFIGINILRIPGFGV